MNKPLVSITCLAYNHEQYIAQTIESFLMQITNFPFEIVIHDDASTDNTAEIIRKYESENPEKIKFICQTENQYSKGIKPWVKYIIPACSGKYIAFCEGDDYWTDPYKLQKQVDFLEANEDFAICFHNATVHNEIDSNEYTMCSTDQKEVTTIEDLIQGNFIPSASVLFRSNKTIKELPDWFNTMPIGDWPLHILNAQYGKIKYINKIMCVYRLHGNSAWSSKGWGFQMYSIQKVMNAVNTNFDGKYKALTNKTIFKHFLWRYKESIRHLEDGRYEAACNNLSEMIEYFPTNIELKYGKIIALFHLNRFAELNKELAEIKLYDKGELQMDNYGNETEFNIITTEERALLREQFKEIWLNLGHLDITGYQYEYSFIKNINTCELLKGNTFLPEIWSLSWEGKTKQAINATTNSRILFNIPTQQEGILDFGIMIHPDVWEKKEAIGGCSFQLIADDRVSFEFVLDPVALPNDRRQYYVKIDIPNNSNGYHEVMLETKALGNNANLCWAMWIEPAFYAK